jgi:hypothetical protein
MKHIIFFFLILSTGNSLSQDSYDSRINAFAKEIVTSLPEGKEVKIAFNHFTFNEKATKLSMQLYEDVTSEIVMNSKNLIKIILLDEYSLSNYNSYLAANSETEKALMLGKLNVANYTCFGKVIESADGYKLQIRTYINNDGALSNAYKLIIQKTTDLANLNSIETEQFVKNRSSENTSNRTGEMDEKQEEIEKPQKKGFWHFLGEVATTGLEIVRNTNNSTSSTGNSTNNSSNNNAVDDPDSTCKAYIKFINKTENSINIKVYLENPADNIQAKHKFSFTLAAGKEKKQKVKKDVLYYYYATNNTGSPVFGGYKDYNGTSEVEVCDTTVDEEIE